jgi:GNAT superfamily N-acetyltransferase
MLDVIKVENIDELPKLVPKKKFIDFLYTHLGKYKDEKQDISKAIQYAFSNEEGKGGFLLIILNNATIVGEAVVNNTGMSGYIPSHILVYIASHNEFRRKGIGKLILNHVLEECNYNVALHVEPDNPAKKLYKKMGFKSKYIEMRCEKKKPLFPPKLQHGI